MTNTRQFVAFARLVQCFLLLGCLEVLGGMQHLTAQAITGANQAIGGPQQARAGVASDVGATTPHLRSTTYAQRKAAAANNARRRAAVAATSSVRRPQAAGVRSNAIAGQPGGAPLTRDELYFSGTYPNYANSPLPNPADTVNCSAPNYCGIRKFVDALPTLTKTNLLGQTMPIAVPDTTTFPGSDYYEISVREFHEKMHTDLPPTQLRGYVQTNNGTDLNTGLNTVAPAPIHYMGPLIVAQRDRPVRVKFTNELPTGAQGDLFIPVDRTVMGSGMGFSITPSRYLDTRTTVHLHGGNTPWISDGTPMEWTVPAGDWANTAYPRGPSLVMVPDMYFVNGAVVPQCSSTVTANCSGGTAAQLPAGATNDPGNGSFTLYYTNQQSARLMFYHDHAYGTTRLNVYAGMAAGYVITDPVEGDLINGTNVSGVFTQAAVAPAPVIPAEEIPLVIQDKTFVPQNPLGGTTIYSVGILENGSGYTAPTVSFGAGCTIPPQATATFGLMTNPWGQPIDGAITGFTITNPGAGCTSDPTVTITDPTGTGAAAYASLATLSQQDPTWDTTAWGGYGNLWFPHVYMPNQFPDNPDGSAVNPMGRWDYASWFWPVFTNQYQVRGDLPCGPTLSWVCPGTPSALDPAPATYLSTAAGGAQPFQGVGSVAATTPEAFMDTMMVNGTVYPVLTVDPKAYRFRILSVGNDRTLNLSLFMACGQGWYAPMLTETCPAPTVAGIPAGTEVGMVPSAPTAGFPVYWPTDGRDGGVPDPLAAGPSWIQIGSEGGVLPQVAVYPPAPINYEYSRRSVTVTNTSSHSLNLMPAERADVIVDFSQYAGKTLILYNDAPAPYPAFDPRYDYYTNDPDQTAAGGAPTTLAGFGPNTRTVMQIKVNSTGAAANYTTTVLPTLKAALPAAFKLTQPTPVVPNAVYNKAYGASFASPYPHLADTQLTFTPIGGTTPVTLPMRNKTIQELFELNFGKMNATLGTELPLTNFNTQTTIPLGYVDPFTEDIQDSASVNGLPVGTLGDGTQLWEVIHNGVDSHAIHFHLYDVQLLDRVGWDGTVRAPDANEFGWKDTVRMNPLEIDFVALRPMSQDLPFPVPDAKRLLDVTMPAGATDPNMSSFGPNNQAVAQTNLEVPLGWEYVWHCHILGHEENDMMRDQVFQVPPQTPTNFMVAGALTGGNATFIDQSLSETGFTLERADDSAFTVNVKDFTLPSQPGYNTNVAYLDTTATPGSLYYYRVRTFKPDVDFYAPGNDLVSAWSSTAYTTLVPTALVSPSPLAFGNQLLTAPAQTLPITLTNGGFSSLSIYGIAVTGTNSTLFGQTNNCPATLTSGSFCTIQVTFTPVSVGNAVAQVSIVSNDPTNPTLSVPLTANAQTAVTVTASSTSIPYGSTVPTITANATGLVLPDTISSLTGLTCSTTYTATSPVGAYPTTCFGAVNSNYLISYVAGTLTVTPLTASVTPNAASKNYGAADPTLTGTLTGFLPANNVTATYARTPGENPGTYTISATLAPTAVLANYSITYNTATFTINPVPAAMVSPAPGSTLSGSSAFFAWSPSGPSGGSYILNVGTTGAGSKNIASVVTTSTSATVNGLPTTGGTVYVQLWYKYTSTGAWQTINYTYTAANTSRPAAMVSPAPGNTLPGSSATFAWSASSPSGGNYILNVGTTGAGSKNIASVVTTSTSATVNGLPTTGGTVYVQLWYKYTSTGAWQTINYTYTASGVQTPAAITSPAPGSTLPGSSATFAWSASSPSGGNYILNVGTTGAGSKNIASVVTTSTSATVNGLPTTGGTVYVQLWYKYTSTGAWQTINYTYTAF